MYVPILIINYKIILKPAGSTYDKLINRLNTKIDQLNLQIKIVIHGKKISNYIVK